MKTTDKHYVTFESPGTMLNESSTMPIESWDNDLACAMAKTVVERHGARPFCFSFKTMVEAPDVASDDGTVLKVQPKLKKESGRHFLGGDILSIADVKARNDPKESILLANMEGNDIPYIIENRNSWRSVQPFREMDVVVNPDTGAIVKRYP